MIIQEKGEFLKQFGKKYNFEFISKKIDELKNLSVLIIGDGIIDEYTYCESMGRSSKSLLVVNKFLSTEIYAGGAFIIANHMAGICKDVHLVTLIGRDKKTESFIRGILKSNVTVHFLYRDDGPTIWKKRYIDLKSNQKMFEINYLNNEYINKECELDIIDYLRVIIPKYGLVLVSDFGHGFITNEIINVIESLSKSVVVNTQTNSANIGFNMITKYHNPFFVCLDEKEARIAVQDRFGDIVDVAFSLSTILNTEYLIITLGEKGSIGVSRNGEVIRIPILSTEVVDTIGAGDAFFAFAAPCLFVGMPYDVVSFIGNAVGALAVKITGNEKSVKKGELLDFIQQMIK